MSPPSGSARTGCAGREDALVEAALTDEQLVHDLQELARARTLDDAVVVRAGERDRLADAELDEGLLARALELGGVLEGAGADDAALALHEARHRVHGADAAGFVSEIVVPWKSAAVSLPRARLTRSS
jgi:hypothetical protein